MSVVTIDDIMAARNRIADGVYHSPCPESIPLSELCGMNIYCKLDYLQRTGSFKERGARNALLLMSSERRQCGVVAASAGNHALGLAYHGQLLGVKVTVVMPRFAPLIKVTTCRNFGARVILQGENYAEAQRAARELAARDGLTFVPGFNDQAIVAGQGTIALEVLEQVPQADAIVVPVGGAGLIAGVSLAVLRLMELEKSIVEGAGATPLAACMSAQLEWLHGKNVVLLLCGGNIDLTMLDRIIERGLVADGRLCRFTAIISDRPGGLAKVAQLIANCGASIKDVEHDRAFSGADLSAVNVMWTVETADRTHVAELYRRLGEAGIPVIPSTQVVEVAVPG